MFLVFGEQIRSLSSKQSKLKILTNYTQKLHFYVVSRHKQPPDDQTIQCQHQVSKKILKAMIDKVFMRPSLGGLKDIINGGRIFQQERQL